MHTADVAGGEDLDTCLVGDPQRARRRCAMLAALLGEVAECLETLPVPPEQLTLIPRNSL